jgi:hypothetical protein
MVAFLAIAASASADLVGGVTFDFVPITAVGAAADFRMGKFEVTEDQWAAFMGGGGSGSTPKVSITFHQAAEFVNALNTAAGSTVAYNIIGGVVNPWGESGVYRDPGAKYWMIDENEFSDAYHNGSAYQDYATPSGALPTTSEANYQGGPGVLWNVGSGAEELNGTFDLMGNAAEFMENDTNWLYPAGAGTNHRFMGGAFSFGSYLLPHTFKYAYGAGGAENFVGFRLGSIAMATMGDFDDDGDIDAADIDLLADAIEAGSSDSKFDVNGDSFVDEQDLIDHIATLVQRTDGGVGTYRGDFNLDGYVDATDLAILKAGFGLTGLGYALGNANADDFVDGTDLAIFKATFGLSGTPGAPNPPAVPEPATISLLALGGLAALRRRRKQA